MQSKQSIQTIKMSLYVNQMALNIFMCLLIAAVMVFHLAFLTRNPTIFIDEPWFANATWNWVTTGVNFDTMHAGTLDQFGVPWLNRPFLGEAPWAGIMALFGLGFFQIRLASWLLGCVLLITLILVGRLIYSLTSGLLAALFLSLSYPFLLSSHYARPDILLAIFMVAAYGLALTALKKNRWWLHLLTGFLLGAALDIHPNTLLFAAGLVVLYAYYYGKTFFRQRGTWLCALGGIAGIFIYVAIHILPDPNAFFSFYTAYTSESGTHQLPLLTFNPVDILRSIRGEISRYRFYTNSVDLVLVLTATVFLASRRQEPDRYLLLFLLSVLACFILVIGNKSEYYAINTYPFLMLMVAEMFVSLLRLTKPQKPVFTFVSTLLALILLTNMLHIVRPVLEHRTYDYYAITDQIKTVIPHKARVLGLPTWWLGLADYDYRSSLNINFYQLYNGLTTIEALEVMKPDIIILDGGFQSILVDDTDGTNTPGWRTFQLPRQEFEDFLENRGNLLLEFHNPWHGQIKVYQIDNSKVD